MKLASIVNSRAVLACLYCSLLAGCDWVDSAGTSGGASVPLAPAANVQIFAGDVLLDEQGGGNVFKLTEANSIRIVTSSQAEQTEDLTFNWSEEPVEQGELPACVEYGFEENANTADTLEQACTDPDNCNLDFEQQGDSVEPAEFLLSIPVLKSSVGVAYELEINDTGEEPVIDRYDFCLVAVNESPDAVPDSFVVIEGQRLEVTESDGNLLSNDTDDIDETNRPLRVLEELLEGPENAALFELGSNGNFVYESSLTGLREDAIDTFVYQITDGVTAASSARVRIRIVVSNRAPVLESDLPLLMATVGTEFEENLSVFFSDPDGNELSFSVVPGSVLPPSGSVSLTPGGVLGGIPQTGDAGDYVISILASDGVGQETQADVSLSIAPVPLINTAPRFVTGSVSSRAVRLNRRMLPIEPEFIDDDGDVLTYTMVGIPRLPRGITLNPETGVISGIPTQRLTVRNLRVRATDGSGANAVTSFFNITVNP
ncbi:MAG: putative Ig domain-containing protein [Granulosicoccus sp.]